MNDFVADNHLPMFSVAFLEGSVGCLDVLFDHGLSLEEIRDICRGDITLYHVSIYIHISVCVYVVVLDEDTPIINALERGHVIVLDWLENHGIDCVELMLQCRVAKFNCDSAFCMFVASKLHAILRGICSYGHADVLKWLHHRGMGNDHYCTSG